ncbi:MAG: GIY-YIG nuclease family protein [bacterium]|nr:GIY-YIG nuclease family protein [bacterium]
MINWFLYIIRCKNKSLYTGITTDIKRRFKEHQEGKGSKYLRGKSPLELVFKKKIGKKGRALRLESAIKKLPKEKKEMILKRKIRINKTNIK